MKRKRGENSTYFCDFGNGISERKDVVINRRLKRVLLAKSYEGVQEGVCYLFWTVTS